MSCWSQSAPDAHKKPAVDSVGIPLAPIRRLAAGSRMVVHGGTFEVKVMDISSRWVRWAQADIGAWGRRPAMLHWSPTRIPLREFSGDGREEHAVTLLLLRWCLGAEMGVHTYSQRSSASKPHCTAPFLDQIGLHISACR